MKLIRVFPRKTAATPDDEDVRFDPPSMFDAADEVHVSVTWTWDKPRAEFLAKTWRAVTDNIKVGGPAYDDEGGEFTPGLYLKKGYVITSRGCPNHCWFCVVPKREGTIRELEVKDGWNLLDSNLLACSREHQEKVFQMLLKYQGKARFTGGLEAARLEPWHVERLQKINPHDLFFAYDTAQDWEPLVSSARMLKDAGIIRPGNHSVRCYVLIGWEKDTIEKAEARLQKVLQLGIMPMAMLFDRGEHRPKDAVKWRRFQREWANPIIVGSKLRSVTNVTCKLTSGGVH